MAPTRVLSRAISRVIALLLYVLLACPSVVPGPTMTIEPSFLQKSPAVEAFVPGVRGAVAISVPCCPVSLVKSVVVSELVVVGTVVVVLAHITGWGPPPFVLPSVRSLVVSLATGILVAY